MKLPEEGSVCIFCSTNRSFSPDPEYKKFLESYSADDEKLTSTPETLLEEIEARNKELIGMKTDILNVNLFSQYRKTYDVQYFVRL